MILIDFYLLLRFIVLFIYLFYVKGLLFCWLWIVWGFCIFFFRLELRLEFTVDIRVELFMLNSLFFIEFLF